MTQAEVDRDVDGILSRFDLGHLGTSLTAVDASCGPPVGASGVILRPNVLGQTPSRVAWMPDKQAWVKCGSIWVGVDLEHPPQPHDLAKPGQPATAGSDVRDSVGRVWRIPVADASAAECAMDVTLPVDYVFDISSGHAMARVKPQFADLIEAARQSFEWFTGAGELSGADRAAIALTALGVNYAITPYEINALHAAGLPIIDDQFSGTVCWVLCGGPLIDEVEKKKQTAADTEQQPTTSDSPPGEAA